MYIYKGKLIVGSPFFSLVNMTFDIYIYILFTCKYGGLISDAFYSVTKIENNVNLFLPFVCLLIVGH